MKDSAFFDWDHGFAMPIDASGTDKGVWTYRHLSDMSRMYHDGDAAARILEREDPVIYKYQQLGCPEREGDLSFGLSVVYPGCVGDEYFMTKGHFHHHLMTAEVYYTLQGSGLLMIENQEGDWRTLPMEAGHAAYVPRGYAHRSINTGADTMVTFYVYAADAGHDYGTIETRGYRHLVVKQNGRAVCIDNPKYCHV